MAEALAAVWAAEEVVSTTAQAAIGAYYVSKPTMPLKATFRQLPVPDDEKTRSALTRADHTLTVLNDLAYVFGGELDDGSLASNDVYSFDLDAQKPTTYLTFHAKSFVEGGPVPPARKKHAASSSGVCVAFFGGIDASGQVIDEQGCLWFYNTSVSTWEMVRPASADFPEPRFSARLSACENGLVLYGGSDDSGTALKDTWLFNDITKAWTRLPDSPISTLSATVANGVLFAISGSDDLSSDLHYLELPSHAQPENVKQHAWKKVVFPTNPLTPGPRPRIGAGLAAISTGQGRTFLAYFFGARQVGGATSATDEKPPAVDDSPNQDPLYWSDCWTFQTPSESSAIRPGAKIKDGIRSLLGLESGEHIWSEVEVLAPAEHQHTVGSGHSGKIHPGPRGYFGFDHAQDGQRLVVWGGINAKGEKEGDGWIISVE